MKRTARPRALFIGAHADDIEIGAGGSVCRLRRDGWDVCFCILTTEENQKTADERKKEAIAGAAVLGVPREAILFMDFPDSFLKCGGDTVTRIRRVLKERDYDPDLVFTHTDHDSHNDHRAAHEITMALFRRKPIMAYPVVNSLIESSFMPTVFTDTTEYDREQIAAMECHKSQARRIRTAKTGLGKLHQDHSTRLGFVRTESFELIIQEGAQRVELALKQNDCPFHRFWYPLIGQKRINLIHAIPVNRKVRSYSWPIDQDRTGISRLHRAFGELWFGQNPVHEYNTQMGEVVTPLLDKEHILISGGATSNQFTDRYFNHFDGLRYVIDHTMPDYTRLRLNDRQTNKSIYPEYGKVNGIGTINRDFGLLTVMKNPANEDTVLIGCMGVHSPGSLACFRVLSERALLKQLLSVITVPLKVRGYQLIIEQDVRNEEARILEDSIYVIPPRKE
ncbi:MAG: hypothetical protein C5B51_14745 [Terriglobia bacterium]|nr:MAG: hypothetical protein C5B51_14745 [Terriglobia bacterium]